MGPLIVALIPGLLLGWRRFSNRQRSSLTLLWVAALVTWAIWSISAYIAVELVWPRHYYAVFPAAAILATAGFEAASTVKLDQIRMRRVLGALVLLAFALAAYAELSFIVKGNPILVISGRQTKVDYLFRNLGRYAEAMQAITDLPPESYIYFLWEPRTLYCQDRNCFPDGITHNWSFLRNVYGDSDEIQAALCKRGITHMLINDLGLSVFQRMEPDFQPQDRMELEELRSGALGNPTHFGDEYTLYELVCADESQ